MRSRSTDRKLAMFLTLFVVFGTVMMQAQSLPTDVTGYETVSVSILATSYDSSVGAPQMARVKYNKTFPLVICKSRRWRRYY